MAASNDKMLTTPQAVNNAIFSVCDILRRSNVAGAMQYVPEVTWILFLRILDERETREAEEAEAVGADFTPSLEFPYRWQDWAAPGGPKRTKLDGSEGPTQIGQVKAFVNEELLPYLHGLRDRPNATPRQRVISEIMSGIDETPIDTDKNLLDVLDQIHEIREANIDSQHLFPLSQAFEGLLLRMGERQGDGGQFYTPREVIRAIVRVINPQVGETIYDPGCGTGGFLAEAYDHIWRQRQDDLTPQEVETLKRHTFYGREKENLVYPIALANLVLHGIDEPHIWHGNTLTGQELYGGLFESAPVLHDVVMTNPPFGGKEGAEAQTQFAYKTSATQVLFLQHIIDSLKPGGHCGMVIDEGVLFRTNEKAFVQTKRKLLDECSLWCVVSLPAGTFIGAGGGVKTNLLFFTKGERTEDIWYYDLSDVKVTKRSPLTLDAFQGFFELLPDRGDSDRSWTVKRTEIEARDYDLKAVNPNVGVEEDTRTPEELLDLIEEQGQIVADALATLRKWHTDSN